MRISDWSSDVCSSDLLIPEEYLGLHRFRRDSVDGARELVVLRMKEAGFLIPHVNKDGGEHDAETRTIQTPFGDRRGVVSAPCLPDQWYVDADTLAQPHIQAVRAGRIRSAERGVGKAGGSPC